MSDADKVQFQEWQWMHWAMQRPAPLAKTKGWPAAMPAISPSFPILAGPDGKLWITRTPTGAEKKARFDIVDRKGRLVAYLERPVNERIVAISASSIFMVSVDEDGVQSLVRYKLPKI
jgi:hypothetical protein